MKKILLIFIGITAFSFSDTGDLNAEFIKQVNKEVSKKKVEVINQEIKPVSFKRDYTLRLISPIASKKGEVYNREYMYYTFYENLNNFSNDEIENPSSKIKIERNARNNE